MRKMIFYFFVVVITTNCKVASSQNWVPFPVYFNTLPWWISVDSVDNYLVFGGSFNWVDSTQKDGICGWDGTNLIDYDGGLRYFTTPGGSVRQTVVYNNELYVCGAFQKCYNKPDSMNSLAKWTGAEWDTVINVTDQQAIFSLSVIDDTLFIGGQFYYLYGQPCAGVMAYYNGQVVKCYSGFPDPNHCVVGVVKYQNELYAYGLITDSMGIGGQIAICKWNNQTQLWERVDNAFYNDLNGSVADAVVYKGELYVCGIFTQSATVAGNYIMKWNGNQWIDIGGLNYYGRDLEVHDGMLFIAGAFTSAGGLPASRIVAYDGINWNYFNTDFINGEITKMAFYNNELYITGSINQIGADTNFRFVAKYNNVLPSGSSNLLNQKNIFTIFPNPASAQFTLHTNEIGNFTITNQLGQIVFSSSFNKENIEINTSKFPKGIYFVQLNTTQNTSTKKLVIQ